jgi:hypothetical protein
MNQQILIDLGTVASRNGVSKYVERKLAFSTSSFFHTMRFILHSIFLYEYQMHSYIQRCTSHVLKTRSESPFIVCFLFCRKVTEAL